MNWLALDLGTRTGWATSYVQNAAHVCPPLAGMLGRPPGDHHHVESGVQVFDVKRGESPGMRYLRFQRWLDEMPKVDLYVYEQAHQRGGAATEIAAGFATRLQAHAATVGANHVAIHTATLKKFATGSGKAGKDEMIQAVRKRWKRDVTDDNEADAVALLYYALEHYGA